MFVIVIFRLIRLFRCIEIILSIDSIIFNLFEELWKMAFNLTHSSIVVRHNHSWHHCSTPERTLSTKDTPHGACLLPGRTGLWAKKKPIPRPLTELQNIRKWIKPDCLILPRQGERVLKGFLPLKNGMSVTSGLSQSWLTQHCIRDFG